MPINQNIIIHHIFSSKIPNATHTPSSAKMDSVEFQQLDFKIFFCMLKILWVLCSLSRLRLFWHPTTPHGGVHALWYHSHSLDCHWEGSIWWPRSLGCDFWCLVWRRWINYMVCLGWLLTPWITQNCHLVDGGALEVIAVFSNKIQIKTFQQWIPLSTW